MLRSFLIELRAALHQVFAGRHVFAEVDGGHPQPHDLAAHAVGNIHRIDAVAERLRHGAALLIERPAGRGHVRVRRAAAQRHRSEQRRVEPAAMLVAALQIQNFGAPSPFWSRNDFVGRT